MTIFFIPKLFFFALGPPWDLNYTLKKKEDPLQILTIFFLLLVSVTHVLYAFFEALFKSENSFYKFLYFWPRLWGPFF